MPSRTSRWSVEWHAELGSTMDRIAGLAASGAPSGTVVVADFQSQGRGTHGRRWVAPPGTCLMFSVLARPDVAVEDLADFPLAIAGSVRDVLRESFGIPAELSPPNDIVISGKKVCGVLVTSRITGHRLDWLTVGIGLNTHMTRAELPLESATSLALEYAGQVPSHGQLLERLLDALVWLLPDESSCAGYTDKPILSNNAQ